MKPAVTFFLLGLVCVFYAASATNLWGQSLFASLALCWLSVGAAYAGIGARLFGKRPNGTRPLWNIAFWPFHLLNSVLLRAWRRGKENPFDEIDKNVLLGCQPNARDEAELRKHDVRAVLDLTCEFGEPAFLRDLNYRSIPVLDTRAPTLAQLQSDADFIASLSKNGAVYVHCALGHGRSALFVAAYLIQIGRAQSVDEALELVRQKRANIGLHPQQRELLEQFVRLIIGAR